MWLLEQKECKDKVAARAMGTAKSDSLRNTLLGRGLDSRLATRVSESFSSVTEVCKSFKGHGADGFTAEEIRRIRLACKRKPISANVIDRLVDECDWKCCLCWDVDSEASLVIHHIEEHAKTLDDSYENLVLLCLDHHGVAHSRWEISRSPCPPEHIRCRKAAFIEAIREWRVGRRCAPGREQSVSIHPVAPPAPRTFAGRQTLISDAIGRLSGPEPCWVALVGMGGIGKSATALKIAESAANNFPGGTLWADLSGAQSVVAIAKNWLRACDAEVDFEFEDPLELFSLLRATLSLRAERIGMLLLVLDDIRDVSEEEVRLFLEGIPANISVLVTTRFSAVSVALTSYPVELAPLDCEASLKIISGYAMLPLDERFEAEDISALLEILEGLPLALELVGKQIAYRCNKPNFSLPDLVHRLRTLAMEELRFHSQRSVAASFAISYESLEPEQRRFFTELAVFAFGSLRLGEIYQVLDIDPLTAESYLDHLVSISMLRWGEQPGLYRIHSLLYLYAEYLLKAKEPEESKSELLETHAKFFATLLSDLSARKNHQLIEEAFTNVAKAFDFATTSERWPLVCSIAHDLWVESSFLSVRARDKEATNFLRAAVRAASELGDTEALGAHIGSLATVHYRLGEIEVAQEQYERAIVISRSVGRYADVAAHLQNLGSIYNTRGQPQKALDCYREALRYAEESRALEVLGNILASMAITYRAIGKFQEALELYNQSLEVARRTNSRLSVGNNLSNIGLLYLDAGRLEEAEPLIREALDIAREIHDRRGEANRLGHLGRLALSDNRGDKVEGGTPNPTALKYLMESIEICEEIGARDILGISLGNLGSLHLDYGDTNLALKYFRRALAIASEINHSESEGRWNMAIGIALAENNRVDESEMHLLRALEIFVKSGSRLEYQARALLERLHQSAEKKNR